MFKIIAYIVLTAGLGYAYAMAGAVISGLIGGR